MSTEQDAWGYCCCGACGGCMNGGAAPDGRCLGCQAGQHAGPGGPGLAGIDPVATLDQLGAKWSPSFGAYATGQIPAIEVICVLCTHAPCDCPPFGTPAYFALIDKLHGRP